MGKITHKDAADMSTPHSVSEVEWKGTASHEIGGIAELDIVRTATKVVASENASAETKAMADGTSIQDALDSLTSGRTWIERVKCVGNFEVSTPISVPSYTCLDLTEAQIELADNANCNVVEVDDAIAVYLIRGTYIGNKGNNSSGCGVYITKSTRVWIIQPIIDSFKEDGIKGTGVDGNPSGSSFVIAPYIVSCDGAGLELYSWCYGWNVIAPILGLNNINLKILGGGEHRVSSVNSIQSTSIGVQIYNSDANQLINLYSSDDAAVAFEINRSKGTVLSIAQAARAGTIAFQIVGASDNIVDRLVLNSCGVVESAEVGLKLLGSGGASDVIKNIIIGNCDFGLATTPSEKSPTDVLSGEIKIANNIGIS